MTRLYAFLCASGLYKLEGMKICCISACDLPSDLDLTTKGMLNLD